ncbi:hypothetical protein HDU97_007676 [Phlyctochytrium planicorne]|nr:hypothetical protein HDU97_007676 [Phlyctochytrium planicorne]
MDKTVRVWNTKSTKTIKILKGHTAGIECLHATEKYCFSGSYDKTVRCYDVESGATLVIFDGHTDGIYCLKFFDGLLFTGSGDKTVRIWDASNLDGSSKTSAWKKFLAIFGIS